MDKDDDFKEKYCALVENLLSSGYAKKLSKVPDDNPRTWYLPHFGAVQANKSKKIRIVFDGAAKTKGTSLNENLLTGPDWTNSLLGVLIRFRQKRFAVIGDIREMFLQIRIRKEDRCAHMFLWRGTDRDRDPDTYEMISMTFGSASSPFTAQYVMRKNALKYQSVHLSAVKAILNNHYVDDYLDSFDDVEEGMDCIKNVSLIQEKCGFQIRNWCSNNSSVIRNLPASSRKERSIDLVSNEITTEKTLGLQWNCSTDTISFGLNWKKIPEDIERNERPTKREMLRILMSVFDPLGMILPFTIQGKILLQDVWRSGIGWDDNLKDREFTVWVKWLLDLNGIKHYHILRAYSTIRSVDRSSELHIFSDASDKAYAAVAYLLTRDRRNNVTISFVAGKDKVAPLKPVSIPRMELQGALLASRLGDTIMNELEINIEKRIFWTDSRTVLGWIQSDPRKYQMFVAHRLGEIDELTNAEEWNWISGKQNPADCATKETGKTENIMKTWLERPEFLKLEEHDWPKQTRKSTMNTPIEEIKREFVAAISKKIPSSHQK